MTTQMTTDVGLQGDLVVRPLGPGQDAIAQIEVYGTPDWDAILHIADSYYDAQAALDDERRMADMRFPS